VAIEDGDGGDEHGGLLKLKGDWLDDLKLRSTT
jgi:hypothetical protein